MKSKTIESSLTSNSKQNSVQLGKGRYQTSQRRCEGFLETANLLSARLQVDDGLAVGVFFLLDAVEFRAQLVHLRPPVLRLLAPLLGGQRHLCVRLSVVDVDEIHRLVHFEWAVKPIPWKDRIRNYP